MTRHHLAAAGAVLLFAGTAGAQVKTETKKDEPASEADRRIQEAVQREVAKMKEQIRDEVRAEMQGAQSAAEFLGTTQEKKRLELLELNGYLRFRYDLLLRMSLNQGLDPSGYALFPRFLTNPDVTGTQNSANMRFRLDPTLNVSEDIRVRATLDFLDNVVLGSNPEGAPRSGIDFGAAGQVPPASVRSFRDAVAVKRAWAEVQTPIGLLSFGRMPSQWGLGIFAHAGNGVGDDLGDSVDRLQLAVPVSSVLGGLTVIPMYDYASSGITTDSADPAKIARLTGQGVDLDPADDVGALGLKVLRLDSPDQARRKLEKGITVLNGGAWFSYRTQRWAFPAFQLGGDPYASRQPVKRGASSTTLDVWFKLESRRLRLELEAVGVSGRIGNATSDPASPLGSVTILQGAAAARAGLKLGEGRLTLGLDAGLASGDRSPGFGNYPGRTVCTTATPPACGLVPGIIDGRQYDYGDPKPDWNNFRFNPAYRVDLILWRELIGGVTDGWYAKPNLRWEILEGFAATAQVVYSQAIYATSTPSTRHKPLGIEVDLGLSYVSDDGFVAWLDYGYLQPLDGLHLYRVDPAEMRSLSRGQALRTGLAVKF